MLFNLRVVIGESLLGGSLPVQIAIPYLGIEPDDDTGLLFLLLIRVIVFGALVVKLVMPGTLWI